MRRTTKTNSQNTLHTFIRACCLMLVFLPGMTAAQDRFEWNSRMQKAYESVTCMRLTEAIALSKAEKAEHPYNLSPLVIDSYAELLRIYFTEDKKAYRSFNEEAKKRLGKIEACTQKSPFTLFSLGLLHFHGALIHIRFDEKWDAALEIRKAYQSLRENRAKYPRFGPNDVFYGVLTSMLGAVPTGYQWLLNLFGFRGSIREGNRMLLDYIEGKKEYAHICRSEALILYPYLVAVLEGDAVKASRFMETSGLDFPRNHLQAFIASNIHLNNQRSEAALRIVNSMESSPAYMPIPSLHYQKGYALLYQYRLSEAESAFNRFLQTFKGDYYVRDVLEKLSWIAMLQQDKKRAEAIRTSILKRGNAVSDADRAATGNAKSGQWPHPILLKARLLSDGGLQLHAWETLRAIRIGELKTEAEKAEYSYRMGRTLDLLGRKDEALTYYTYAMRQGDGLREYFAARAALQTGLIFEERKDCTTALSYFSKCLGMTGHEYKNSLDQKAKAGLQRCKN